MGILHGSQAREHAFSVIAVMSEQGQLTGPFQYRSRRMKAATPLLPGYRWIDFLLIFFSANTRAHFSYRHNASMPFSLLLSCVTERTFSHARTNPSTLCSFVIFTSNHHMATLDYTSPPLVGAHVILSLSFPSVLIMRMKIL